MAEKAVQATAIHQVINGEDYEHFGFKLHAPSTRAFVSAMADTGCQSCLAGFKVVKKLGLSTKDLIPVDDACCR